MRNDDIIEAIYTVGKSLIFCIVFISMICLIEYLSEQSEPWYAYPIIAFSFVSFYFICTYSLHK